MGIDRAISAIQRFSSESTGLNKERTWGRNPKYSYGWAHCQDCTKAFRDVDNKKSIEEEGVCMACSWEKEQKEKNG